MDYGYKEVVTELKATQKELLDTKKLYVSTVNQNHDLILKNQLLQDELNTLKNGNYS